ncbi:unnamed protein product [Anisakis simplex]|uniref:Frizzled domain-containing protein n=1 Tax=Anisakis simplex TaxID=6269 RepID=A0A0M3KBM6_ANISI|nr:unnamed protein product [Anisakis simplex]
MRCWAHNKTRAMLIPLVVSLCSLLTFISGISITVIDIGYPQLNVALLGSGLFGLCVSAVIWALRPQALMTWPKCMMSKMRRRSFGSVRYAKGPKVEMLNRDNTEVVMRSIRGIPYLIQAIQYSMEATYYKDMMDLSGEGVVRTSVIHTAPGCTSVLDSDHENDAEEGQSPAPVPPIGPDEQWTPTGSSMWKNTQLRLSLNRASSTLSVFPYAEGNLNNRPDSFDVDSTLDSETKSRRSSGRSADVSDEHASRKGNLVNRPHEIRCIGMSETFIQKFNSSFKSYRQGTSKQ